MKTKSSIEGIRFINNKVGRKKAVMIDLRINGSVWEDFYDTLVAQERAHEPRESLSSVRSRLIKQGKLDA